MSENAQPKSTGIQINKKTIALICTLAVVLLAGVGILANIIPQGTYEYNADGTAIADSYTVLAEQNPLQWWQILLSPILALNPANSYFMTGIIIVVFIVVIGGTFLVVDECGVLKYIMGTVVKKFSDKKYFLLMLVSFICMAMSSTAGILEESLTLVPLAVAISLALGWDSLVGLGMSMLSIGFGFSAATFNPFTVVSAQKMAGLSIYSGVGFRILTFLGVYAVLDTFLILYAKRIEKHPEKSVAYESDKALAEKFHIGDTDDVLGNPKIAKASKAFGICLGCVIALILLDFVINTGGILSSAAMPVMFALGAILAAYFSGMTRKEFVRNFGSGVKTLAPVLPFFILILGIIYVLSEGQILPTILHAIYEQIDGIGSYGSLLLIFAFISVFNFFIGSGSIKVLLTMPILLPLADMLDISRQSVILAFCMGDGFTNMLYPTGGIMIIGIGMVGLSYRKWLRFSWPLFTAILLLCIGLQLLAVAVGYC